MPVAFDAVAAADNGHELWSSPAPTKGTGFVHRVFTMYHATSVAAAKEILRCGGLRLSNGSGNMLGAGVYATHTYEKALSHGWNVVSRDGNFVVFQLVVYVGKVYRVMRQGDPLQKTWQSDYNSAWVKPRVSRDLSRKGFQENALKSPNQVRIVGVCRGFDLLSKSARSWAVRLREPEAGDPADCARRRGGDGLEPGMERRCAQRDREARSNPDANVEKQLAIIQRRNGIVPFMILVERQESYCFLTDREEEPDSYTVSFENFRRETKFKRAPKRFKWVFSGDGNLENVETGRRLSCADEQGEVYLVDFEGGDDDLRTLKWRASAGCFRSPDGGGVSYWNEDGSRYEFLFGEDGEVGGDICSREFKKPLLVVEEEEEGTAVKKLVLGNRRGPECLRWTRFRFVFDQEQLQTVYHRFN